MKRSIMKATEVRLEMEMDARRILNNTMGEPTNWCVITGAPGSGKTRVLSELEARGFHASHDVSRAHLEKLLEEGGDKYRIREDQLTLQTDILWKMIVAEGTLPRADVVFLEYALPDNIVFWKLAGLPVAAEVWHASVRFRYKHIFLLESLPLAPDRIRTETVEYQEAMHRELQAVYAALGYSPTKIPAASPAERVSRILEAL